MANVAEGPKRWPRIYGLFRRYLLHRFPFSAVYIERGDFIEIIAVAHHRRKPGYWIER
jgi:toxin ParE1/3/4